VGFSFILVEGERERKRIEVKAMAAGEVGS